VAAVGEEELVPVPRHDGGQDRGIDGKRVAS
jgi:hypothetical protein